VNAPVMTAQRFPSLDAHAITGTKDALHAYARVVGAWLKTCQPKRKHWWHASLRPSLSGLSTGVIHAGVDIELELDLIESQLQARTSVGEQMTESLHGQPLPAPGRISLRAHYAKRSNTQALPEGHKKGREQLCSLPFFIAQIKKLLVQVHAIA